MDKTKVKEQNRINAIYDLPDHGVGTKTAFLAIVAKDGSYHGIGVLHPDVDGSSHGFYNDALPRYYGSFERARALINGGNRIHLTKPCQSDSYTEHDRHDIQMDDDQISAWKGDSQAWENWSDFRHTIVAQRMFSKKHCNMSSISYYVYAPDHDWYWVGNEQTTDAKKDWTDVSALFRQVVAEAKKDRRYFSRLADDILNAPDMSSVSKIYMKSRKACDSIPVDARQVLFGSDDRIHGGCRRFDRGGDAYARVIDTYEKGKYRLAIAMEPSNHEFNPEHELKISQDILRQALSIKHHDWIYFVYTKGQKIIDLHLATRQELADNLRAATQMVKA